MEIMIMLVVSGLFALACNTLAAKRNRSPVGWGVAGFFFGIFALLVLLILGDSPEQNT